MEDKGHLGMIIVAFLLIILGAVFASQLADSNWLHRNTYTVTNETIESVSNVTTVQMAHYPVQSITTVGNATGTGVTVPTTNYTLTTGSIYNMYNGKFILNRVDSPFDGEDLNITYKYYPSGYVRQSNARVLLNLIPLFFVIGVLLFVLVPILKKLEVFGQ